MTGSLTIKLGSSGGGSSAWGAITGTLSNQTDLQAALDLKANLSSPDFQARINILGGGITSGLLHIYDADSSHSVRFITSSVLAANYTLTIPAETGTLALRGANTFAELQQFTGTTHAGLRLNNLTTAERDAIASPQAGMAIWNTTAARLQLHNGSAWTAGMVRLDGDTMTGALTIGVGTLATTGLRLTQTWNGGAGTTHRGMDVAVTATAGQFAAASSLFRVLGGAAGATDRMVLTEEKLVITGTEAVGQVFSIASSFGTTTFAVGGGGALVINNSAQVTTNGLSGFQTGNSANGVYIGWDSQSSLPSLRPTGAVLQVGSGSATPTAYTLRGASSRAGTDTNVAGASLTIAGGNGTGTGGGGSLIFQTAPTGSTGSTANTLTTRMTIDNAGAIAFPNVTAVTTETVVSDRTWPVTINGVSYKICLKV